MGERILDVRDFSVDYGWGDSACAPSTASTFTFDRSKVLGIAARAEWEVNVGVRDHEAPSRTA